MIRLQVVRTPKPKPSTKEAPLPTTVKDLQQAIYWERYEKSKLRERVRWQIGTLLAFVAAAVVAGVFLGGMLIKGIEIPPVSLRDSCEVQVARLVAMGRIPEHQSTDNIGNCITYYGGDPSLPAGI
jgi:hypothetical protein